MSTDKITFVINGNTYSIGINDPQSFASIAKADQEALLSLLASFKQQQEALELRANQRLAQVSSSRKIADALGHSPTSHQSPQKERLGRGDADALMAKLIMEEKARQKNLPNKGSFYKWIFGGAIFVIIWILLF